LAVTFIGMKRSHSNGTNAGAVRDDNPAPLKRGRQTTSAIPGTDISEVRRSLKKLRKFADEALPTQPLCITDMLTNNDSVEQFALRFVLGHHLKRANRVKRSPSMRPATSVTSSAGHSSQAQAAVEDDSEDDGEEEDDDDDDADEEEED
jgi:hypothetical protein